MQQAMKQPVPMGNGRLIGYARVSTSDQRLDLQIDALRKAGVHDDNLHKDYASGARVSRKGLAEALRDIRAGDVLVVWKLDRLGRSLPDLLKKMEELDRIGAGFRSLTEAIDTTTAMGKLILHLMGSIAQFERDLTRERTAAGIRSAVRRGVRMGAKPKLDDRMKAQVAKLLQTDMTVKEVAKRMKVSPGTIYNHFPGGRSGLDVNR
jgi:DNA invertase Pin-like site-specific DNA recombinase